MYRITLALGLLVAMVGCDSLSEEPPVEAPPPVVTPTPAAHPVQTKTIRAMHVFGIGMSNPDNPLLVSEADTLRGTIAVNVWAEVETATPCSENPNCRTVWTNHPLSSRTTLRLSAPISVDGTTLASGSDLMPLLDIWEQASLITPLEHRSVLFAVRLDPARYSVPAGPVTVSMTWGLENGESLSDTTSFIFIP